MKDALFVLLCVLQLIDAATTLVILKRGGRELNKPLAKLMEAMGSPLAALLLVKLALLGIVLLAYANIPAWVLGAMCAIFAVVCWHNWRQIEK